MAPVTAVTRARSLAQELQHAMDVAPPKKLNMKIAHLESATLNRDNKVPNTFNKEDHLLEISPFFNTT